jgi:hypothetical protein
VIPLSARLLLAASLAATLTSPAHAQVRKPFSTSVEPARTPPEAPPAKAAAVTPDAHGTSPDALLKSIRVGVLLADVGYSNGFRLSNLGGHQEVYIPIPQGVELNLPELVLAFDDVSTHEARRSLEILVNDRSVSAIVLDGKSIGRTVRVALTNAVARDGFLKLSFHYSGAATQDRCIDVRYVGDSVTVRPESTLEVDIGITGIPNITATAALMPQNVSVLLSNPELPPADIATALTLARSLTATGRRVTFHHGVEALPELIKREDRRRWTRGVIVVGGFDLMAGRIDTALASVASAAGAVPVDNTLAAVRIGGAPVLLVTDAASARAGRLLGNPPLAALRDTPAASIGQITSPKAATDRVSFDELGLAPAQAEVYGRADLSVAIERRTLPSGARPSRLVLDIMVAVDGTGEKAVVSAFVNERMLASTVAAVGEPTRLDIPLPDGLVGSVANIRAVVQRRSAQGDCKFEPQGFPAQILGSSSVILSPAGSVAEDFSDLASLWADGVEVLVPASTASRPLAVVGLLAHVLNALSNESAPIVVKYVDPNIPPVPGAPFLGVGNVAPAGATQRVRFDRGRVVITDRADRTRLDLGGLATGAVAQIVTSGAYPGLWIKPLTSDGSLPVSPAVYLDRGDVAFLDKTGVALALSTERDTLLRIAYPDQGSWLTFLGRFRPWIVGAVWVLLTIVLLFVVQRTYRRRRTAAGSE